MKKIIYRLFLSMLTAMLVFVFFIGGMPPLGATHYDTIEVLQSAFPDFYYFNIDLPEKTLVECCAVYEDNIGCFNKRGDYYGYIINYTYKYFDDIYDYTKNTIFEPTFSMSSNSIRPYEYWTGTLITSYGYTAFDYTVDNVECMVFYRNEVINRYNNLPYDITEPEIRFYLLIEFELDNVAYEMSTFFIMENDKSEEEYINFFLSTVTPAIENRYKITN